MAFNRYHNFNNVNELCSRVFDEETGRLHVKSHSEKWSRSLFVVFVVAVAVVVVFVFVIFLGGLLLLLLFVFVLVVVLFFWFFTFRNVYLNFSLM